MPSVAPESPARTSGVARTRNLPSTASPSHNNGRNQSPTSPYLTQWILQSATNTSPDHTRLDGVRFDNSGSVPPGSPSEGGVPPPDTVELSGLDGTTGQIAAPTRRPSSFPVITSAAPLSQILKWSIETKVSVFQTLCTIIGLGITILFGVYAFKQGNAGTQATDRSLAISMWQACMQFPDSPATQSSKWCQENLNNTLEDLEARSSRRTRPEFILEPGSIPDWILLPNEFDRSTCYMVCGARKTGGLGINMPTESPTFGLSSSLQELAAAAALGIARHWIFYNILGGVLSAGGGIIFAYHAWLYYPRRDWRVNMSRQLPSGPSKMLSLGKHLALLGRVMTYSGIISSGIVLPNPDGRNWVGLLMYSTLVLFTVYYSTLRRYLIECWIYIEIAIHYMLLRPTSAENALICLLIYGPFYIFLLDYVGFFQWYIRKLRVVLYCTSVVVFLTYTLLNWQIHLLMLGVAVSLSPLYYLFEQTWN